MTGEDEGGALGGGIFKFREVGRGGSGGEGCCRVCIRVRMREKSDKLPDCSTGRVSTEPSVGFGGFDFLVAGEVCARLLE